MLKFFSSLTKFAIISAIWVGIILFFILFYYSQDLPDIKKLKSARTKKTAQVDYSNGNKITTIGDFYDIKITYNQLPKHLINAVISTEDRKFFKHFGIDIFGITRAFYVNYRAGKILQGGSTITQQLAKILFLTPKKTIKRKIQEMLLAIQLEAEFSKEQILTLYLNRAYFGAGNYGIASACKYYFNKPVPKINLNEAALIAGLLKAPSRFSPTNNKKLAEKRANQVIRNMVDAGYLGYDNISDLDQNIDYKIDGLQRLYFIDFLSSQLSDYLSSEHDYYNVQSTLNEEIQNAVEQSISSFLKKNSKSITNAQISLLVMSKKGEILSMIGGRNYKHSQFNRAIYSRRQPGSIFKAFVYLTAFQNGFRTDDLFEDKKVQIGDWSPDNYNNKYHGEVTIKKSFALSLNSVAIQLAQKLDKKEIIRNSRKMGIISDYDEDDPTLALGTIQVSLLELVTAYATIANGGFAVIPYSIKKITDKEGNILFKRISSGLGRVIKNKHVIMLKEILREAVASGTGKKADINKHIHGKTGTSQGYRDAWFIGFDDKFTIGVWVGNDDNSPTNNITGGSVPAQLFAATLKAIRDR